MTACPTDWPLIVNPEDDPEGFAFALLDVGYSKEEAAAAAGMSVEMLNFCLKTLDDYSWLKNSTN